MQHISAVVNMALIVIGIKLIPNIPGGVFVCILLYMYMYLSAFLYE